MARCLALVRHSTPVIDPTVPASEWLLSDEGRLRCQAAADALAVVSASRIYSSEEPKAVGTAQEIGRLLGLPVEIASDLHEHERPQLPFIDAPEWHRLIAEFFASPDTLVLGHETGHQARLRFERAIDRLVRATQDEGLIVVTHGTVMSLYLSRLLPMDAFQIWEGLEMPDVRIVDLSEPI